MFPTWNLIEKNMSGGSLNYIYLNVEEASHSVKRQATKPLHKAFARHLKLVAEALHDLEWVQSGDYGEGDEDKAILAVLGKDAKQKELEVIKEELEKLFAEFNKVFEEKK